MSLSVSGFLFSQTISQTFRGHLLIFE
jgi:hypothetical protein